PDFYALKEKTLADNESATLIRENMAVNSTAYLEQDENGKTKALGTPTAAALLLWLHEQGTDYLAVRTKTKVFEQLAFSTERKFMATLVRSSLDNRTILYIKGAPEIILSRCSGVATPQGIVPVSEWQESIEKQLSAYQNQAMRTLGFAYRTVENDRYDGIESLLDGNWTFLGIVAISDPVREDVPAAVQKCMQAGIDVKIVTGDTAATAREVGRQIGLWNDATDSGEQIISGTEFEQLADAEAALRAQKLKIMCRARPTDKQRLVQLLKQSGAVVAVTGDGTNDAPALNYADVGLSMGSGTSVAKEASDITLLDDSFNSIATAVMWGRSLYHNIQRFILFQLTINLSALLIVLVGSLLGHELPLTVPQMLWVNMIIDTFAAAALASLPPDPRVMYEKPRKTADFIITQKMKRHILGIGVSFAVFLLGMMFWFDDSEGGISRYELSVFFTTFVMLQFWNMFNAKAFLSRASAFKHLKASSGFLIVIVIILVGQYLIVRFGGDVFRTQPLSWKDWGILIGGTSLVLWIGEIARRLSRKNGRR
ncbi:MAG: cation-translocating P-type ATPase, partial [Odoribacter sp.]|nr:cation-translocating P-type ATPase [Odoribacter sp.]